MDLFEHIADWIRTNQGKTIGAAAGFIAGIMFFTLGWWKTFIIILLTAIGFLIGKARDDDVSIIDQLSSLFRRKRD